MTKVFKRSRSGNRFLGGVCGGLAKYWSETPEEVSIETTTLAEVDPTWVRLGWATITLLTGGFMVFVYLTLWIITSKESKYN